MRLGGWLTAPLLALSVGLVSWARPLVAASYTRVASSSDSYALPAPSQLIVFSLGYRSALADLLFGRTLVASGIHFSSKRVFESLDSYLDAVATLDPLYRDVYYYADPLLTLSSVEMPKRNYRIARDFQERGRKLFPDDAELWMSSGLFMAYLAPQHLPEGESVDEWKVAGAHLIEHACNVWPDQHALPAACISVATLLSRAGEVAASEGALRRLIAITDDPQVKSQAIARLTALLGAARAEEMRKTLGALGLLHAHDLPLSSRAAYQMMGPPSEFARCSGELFAEQSVSCTTSWRAWSELAH